MNGFSQTDDAGLKVLLDAFRRWNPDDPAHQINVLMDRRTGWFVMSALQLAWRHPTAPLKAEIEGFARWLQGEVCDTAEVYTLAELGWDQH